MKYFYMFIMVEYSLATVSSIPRGISFMRNNNNNNDAITWDVQQPTQDVMLHVVKGDHEYSRHRRTMQLATQTPFSPKLSQMQKKRSDYSRLSLRGKEAVPLEKWAVPAIDQDRQNIQTVMEDPPLSTQLRRFDATETRDKMSVQRLLMTLLQRGRGFDNLALTAAHAHKVAGDKTLNRGWGNGGLPS